MPLKKLWNSLCGRSTPADADVVPRTTEAPKATNVSGATQPSGSSKAVSSNRQTIDTTTKASPRRSVLSMITKGEHDALIKTIRKSGACSVLEIGVGDGSRMPAILSALVPQKDGTSVKAAVIDEFEMGRGSVTIRDYHRQLGGLEVRPAIVPEPIGRGITSVANRLGTMDVVLIDSAILAEGNEAEASELQATIGKVLHASSVVLSNESGKWTSKSFANKRSSNRRAA